jgi:glycosyltransferase involved in cell wall biosynthesis
MLCVHRVDGPIDIYRGREDGIDLGILKVNQEIADKTIFQSHYSLDKHSELGLDFREPVVILNAADPSIFHSRDRLVFGRARKIRLLASSWSDNVHKGGPVYKWLDEHLDWERYEFTFVGRSALRFHNIRHIAPVDSRRMAELYRENDIYLTASKNDPCSNSLIEALTCGMPALYLRSGGHPEIVGEAGFGFESAEEIPALLDRLVAEYEIRQGRIAVPSIKDVTSAYLSVMELL